MAWDGVVLPNAIDELVAAVEWLQKEGRWRSIDKDNMEFECQTTTFVINRLNNALARVKLVGPSTPLYKYCQHCGTKVI